MNETTKAPLTLAEEAQLASLLQRANWPLKPHVFDAALGLIPTVAFELVVFRGITADDYMDNVTGPEVLLLPRPEKDPFFAGLVHGPGTVMRRGDTEASALCRAMREFGGPESVTTPIFAGISHVPMGPLPNRCPRGQEIGLVYYCWMKEGVPSPKGAVFANVNRLPDNIIGFHRFIVAMAIEKYRHDAYLRHRLSGDDLACMIQKHAKAER